MATKKESDKAKILQQRTTEANLRAAEALKRQKEKDEERERGENERYEQLQKKALRRQDEFKADAIELSLKEWQIVRFKRQAEAKAKELMRQKYYEAQRLNQPQEPEDKELELERLSDKFYKELKEAAKLKQQQEVQNSRKTVIEFANELNIPTDQVRTYLMGLGISLTRDESLSYAIQKHILAIHQNPSSPEAITFTRDQMLNYDIQNHVSAIHQNPSSPEAIKFKEKLLRQKIEALNLIHHPNAEDIKPRRQQNKALQSDRQIPKAVKISVWRRDYGKCVECNSNEKIEYDHIIPVSKGGSNTERNIQLLCEKCNRKKAAKIQ